MMLAMAIRLELAPCSLPCSLGETWRDIRPCAAGEASPHRANTGMPAQNIQPVGASPKITNPSTPNARPAIRLRRSPKRRTTGRTRSPPTTAEHTPTPAKVSPTVRSSQP